MIINKLSLKSFRNYKSQEIELGKGINVFHGDNAQGKTNLIEAIYMFSFGRSYRTASIKELILFNEEFSKLTISFSDRRRDYKGEIVLTADKKKRIKINDVNLIKISELMGYLNVVLFCPEELNIIKAGPSERRRFLDMSISQLRPKYFSTLCTYHKTLEQRNNLLKNIKRGEAKDDTMFVWNEKLADTGKDIIEYRAWFIEKIKAIASRLHKDMTNEELLLSYKPSVCDKEDFLKRLNHGLKRDIELCTTLHGPHRDDFDVYINKNNVRTFGSQGQQRTAVLSLKLSQSEFIKEEKDEYPVILLDDILSELDLGRRKYLLNNIKDKQVIITATDADSIRVENENISYFKVVDGTIEMK